MRIPWPAVLKAVAVCYGVAAVVAFGIALGDLAVGRVAETRAVAAETVADFLGTRDPDAEEAAQRIAADRAVAGQAVAQAAQEAAVGLVWAAGAAATHLGCARRPDKSAPGTNPGAPGA